MEVTIEHARKTAGATIVNPPFFDPPRKRALFAASNGRAVMHAARLIVRILLVE